jgi:hypothetical protein
MICIFRANDNKSGEIQHMVIAAKAQTSTARRVRKAKPQVPQRMYPESRVNRIATLELGESESAAIRLPLDGGLDKDHVKDTLESLRLSIAKAMNVAGKRSGNTYTVESGQFFVAKGDIVVTVVVTRTA